MPEVRKCTKCGTRVNWPWFQNIMAKGTWGRRCSDAACQSLEAWALDEPDHFLEADGSEKAELRAALQAMYDRYVADMEDGWAVEPECHELARRALRIAP